MNKIMVGTIIGTAVGVSLAVLAKMAKDRGYFDQVSDSVSDLAYKAKRKVQDVMDAGANEAEYLKDKAQYQVKKGKKKIDDMIDDIQTHAQS
jgi:ElaB/YqjD/DUF883 family membrane-anchored ribosome-binding protein